MSAAPVGGGEVALDSDNDSVRACVMSSALLGSGYQPCTLPGDFLAVETCLDCEHTAIIPLCSVHLPNALCHIWACDRCGGRVEVAR